MPSSPPELRRFAREYRSISQGIGTPEVRSSLCRLADEFDRRADILGKMSGQVLERETACGA